MTTKRIDRERQRMIRKTRPGKKAAIAYQFKTWGCRVREARTTCQCRVCDLVIPAGAPVINVRDRGEKLVDYECLPCGKSSYQGDQHG